jgi:polyketide synthase PksN
MSPNETEYVSSTGSKLSQMLTGKESALAFLFPEDPSAVSAEAYYMDALVSQYAHRMVNTYLSKLLKDTPALLEENKETLRILEVGAGTGSFTKTLLAHLQGSPSNWEYTYTDLSPIFFAKGQKIFEGSRIKVHYKILNIEEDTASQGYLPAHFDIIIANNVIHATKNIAASSRNLRNLLRDNGLLLVTESTKPVRGTNLTFGLLDAYWHYQDFELRGFNCELSEDKWKRVLKGEGFDLVESYASFENKFCMVAAKAEKGVSYAPTEAIVPQKQSKVWFLFTEDCE